MWPPAEDVPPWNKIDDIFTGIKSGSQAMDEEDGNDKWKHWGCLGCMIDSDNGMTYESNCVSQDKSLDEDNTENIEEGNMAD